MIITGANVTANVAVVVIIVESAVICLVGAVEIVVAMGFAIAQKPCVLATAETVKRVATRMIALVAFTVLHLVSVSVLNIVMGGVGDALITISLLKHVRSVVAETVLIVIRGVVRVIAVKCV